MDKKVLITWTRLYNKGFSIEKIASLYKVAPEKIKKSLVSAGVLKKEKAYRKNQVTPEEVKQWIELYNECNCVYAIAKECGISYGSIYKHLDRAGVIRKKFVPITTKMIKEWVAIYNTGDYNITYISNKYKISRNTIAKYLHLSGVKTTKKVFHNIEV